MATKALGGLAGVWHERCKQTSQEKRVMPNNTASWDRIVRVIAGLLLVSLVFVGPQTPFGWLGLIFVVTGAVGFCPLYRIFGISTCPVNKTTT